MTDRPRPQAAYIELVDHADIEFDPAVPGSGVMKVDEVRINGTPLLTTADEGVEVHGVSTNGDDRVVKVTLTLFARRVEYKREPRTS